MATIFHAAFAADLPPEQTAVMAATKRRSMAERAGATIPELEGWRVISRPEALADVILTAAAAVDRPAAAVRV